MYNYKELIASDWDNELILKDLEIYSYIINNIISLDWLEATLKDMDEVSKMNEYKQEIINNLKKYVF